MIGLACSNLQSHISVLAATEGLEHYADWNTIGTITLSIDIHFNQQPSHKIVYIYYYWNHNCLTILSFLINLHHLTHYSCLIFTQKLLSLIAIINDIYTSDIYIFFSSLDELHFNAIFICNNECTKPSRFKVQSSQYSTYYLWYSYVFYNSFVHLITLRYDIHILFMYDLFQLIPSS